MKIIFIVTVQLQFMNSLCHNLFELINIRAWKQVSVSPNLIKIRSLIRSRYTKRERIKDLILIRLASYSL